jgi:1,2-phenylacetyl-CoA epoxidase PaaB subunit
MTSLQQEPTDCIYGITSEFEVAKIWVRRSGAIVTLQPHDRGQDSVDTPNQDNLVSHASRIYSLTRAFKIPAMFSDTEEAKRKISELQGKAAAMKASATKGNPD